METLLALVWAVVSTLSRVVWWVVSTLLWIAVWFLLPFLIVAFIALRLAERAFGEEAVRAWVKARATRFGGGTWDRLRPLAVRAGRATVPRPHLVPGLRGVARPGELVLAAELEALDAGMGEAVEGGEEESGRVAKARIST